MNEKERARLRALGMMTVGYVELRMRAMSLKIHILKVDADRVRQRCNKRYSREIFTQF